MNSDDHHSIYCRSLGLLLDVGDDVTKDFTVGGRELAKHIAVLTQTLSLVLYAWKSIEWHHLSMRGEIIEYSLDILVNSGYKFSGTTGSAKSLKYCLRAVAKAFTGISRL